VPRTGFPLPIFMNGDRDVFDPSFIFQRRFGW
jgi:hypothetical protein